MKNFHSVLEIPRLFTRSRILQQIRGTNLHACKTTQKHSKMKAPSYIPIQFSHLVETLQNDQTTAIKVGLAILKQRKIMFGLVDYSEFPDYFSLILQILKPITLLISTYFYTEKHFWLTINWQPACRLKKQGSMFFVCFYIYISNYYLPAFHFAHITRNCEIFRQSD